MSKKAGRFLSLCIAILLLLGTLPAQAATLPVTPETLSVDASESIPGESENALVPDERPVSSAIAADAPMAAYSYVTTGGLSTIPDGIYAFKNLGNANRWMDVEQNKTTPGAHMQQYGFSTSPADSYSASGLFRISRVGTTNRYIIRLVLKETLTFGISGNEVITKTIPANDADVSPQDTFRIYYKEGGFIIAPYGLSCCVAANETTASGMSGAPDSYLLPKALTSGESSRWIIEGYETIIPDGVYAFRNMGNTNRWINVGQSSTAPGAHIQQFGSSGTSPAATFDRSCLFKVKRIAGTSYSIRLMLNNNLSFGISGSNVLTKTIPAMDSSVSSSNTFTVSYNNGGFLIKPYGSSYCIAANSTTASGDAGAPGSYLKPRTLAEAGDCARWMLECYTGDDQGGCTLNFPNTLKAGETAEVSAITWSTVIGANAYLIGIDPSDANLATATLDLSTGKTTVKAHRVGTPRFLVYIKTGFSSDNVHVLSAGQFTVQVPFEEGNYFIRNIDMNLFMQIDDDDEPNYSTSGAIMELFEFDGGDYQRWKILHVTDGYYKILSVISNRALSVSADYPGDDGEALIQQTYTGADRQLWKITKSSRGNYVFRPKSGEAYSTDWCMASGSGFIIQNGRDVEQRAYTDDANLKDEWELERLGTYQTKLCGIKNSWHDHESALETVLGELYNAGYNNVQLKKGTVSSTVCKEYLQSSNVFTSRSHGHLIVYSGTSTAAATGIVLNDEDGADLVGLYSHTWSGMTTGSTSILSTDSFDKAKLVLLIGCSTAYGGESGRNLPAILVDNGATTSIGFKDTINCSDANKWTKDFYSYMLSDHTVKEAVEYASSRRSESSGLKSAVIFGDENYKFGN